MKTPPSTWYWGRLHDLHGPASKAIGYYYRDKTGGPSFHVVVDVTNGEDAAEIKRAAAACNYRGEVTMRLGAHEEIFADNVPPSDADFLRKEFDDPSGPVKTRVMRLTAEERSAFGLPDAPDWAQFYL
jgi:hypothetical protein